MARSLPSSSWACPEQSRRIKRGATQRLSPPASASACLPAGRLSKPVFNSVIKASDVRALLARSESHLHSILKTGL